MLGSFTEGLINKAIEIYDTNNIAYFRKSYISSLFFKNSYRNSKKYSAIIKDKGDVDYYGIYNGQYVCFEVKETVLTSWSIGRLKEHQYDILKKVHNLGGISFLVLNFVNQDNQIYFFDMMSLHELHQRKNKKITLTDAKKYGKQLTLCYPGYIDFLRYI